MRLKIILFLLKAAAAMPLPLLYLLSDFIYIVVYRVLGYRRKVVRQNLSEAFPEKSKKDLRKLEKDYYHYMCDIIVETVKLLHISPEEMAERVRVVNPEIVRTAVEGGRSAVLLLGHYGNWEWVQEISSHVGECRFKASIYHPLHSKLWDEVYKRIRSRWEVNIIPQLNAVRALLDKDHQPWVCGFIADHRPGQVSSDNRTPFLHHDTSFIYGPEMIGNKVGAAFFYLEMKRMKRGYYQIIFHPLSPIADGRPYPVTRAFWREFERVIKENPAYWLWSHKRWKKDPLLKG